jgi:exonuclease VII small subunit
MKKLNILNIRIDGGTQPRNNIDYDVVTEYAELMREGTKFPPVDVFFDGAEYWLADGFHRYHATKANATASIDAIIHTGSLRDAQLFSWGANKGRGLTMKKEDCKEIIRKMLLDEEWSKWTQSAIASHVGVTAMMVSRVKKSMEDTPELGVKKYVTKDGKEVKVDTSKMATKKAPTTKPDVSTYDEREDKIRELTEVVTQLSEENSKLRDAISLGQWDASDIEKIDIEETVVELREQVKILEIDNKALRESRDMFQNRNSELMRTVSSLQRKLKQYKEEV